MKLIVSGATGFLGREVVRQSLATPGVTSVVALARKPVTFSDSELLPGSDAGKLVHATIKDYGEYPPEVTAHFAGADACIWTVGISPFKSKTYPWPEVVRVCQTCTIQGFSAMLDATATVAVPPSTSDGSGGGSEGRPFRFVYVSGMGAEPDQSKKPFFSPQYLLMRGETENKVHSLPASHPGAANRPVSTAACRFGMISSPGMAGSLMGSLAKGATGWPTLSSVEGARVLIDQAVNGFYEGKGTLTAGDMAAIWKRISAEEEGKV
ncbi:uncharacterized protein B0I36DRAFT_363448 [Microdochium trichocladiopsis]|uniref:NAD(P)-binding domain-containing protein n=1 Tax=Microdochium trichocladiopsis TaxID=1682393 RepID=A0A9P9BSG5_9PEZI|nr:uncharacterized protein B0I36DRAFT_363448 [Microdochium trichocladiopsis]KAH7028826.1 hypothetical protein B0I36DRAFT_363448 [Microdochium trichocladiopsis]